MTKNRMFSHKIRKKAKIYFLITIIQYSTGSSNQHNKTNN